jgi:hypothetical protein
VPTTQTNFVPPPSIAPNSKGLLTRGRIVGYANVCYIDGPRKSQSNRGGITDE